jgi:HEAT repeat protein
MRRHPPLAAVALAAALVVLASGPAAAQIRGPHEERVREVRDLAAKGDVESTKKIVEYLSDKHPFPRDEAFSALVRLKDRQAIQWLATEGLHSADADVRADIIEALLVLRAKEAGPPLVKLLGRDERNRALICDALAEIGSASDADALVKLGKGGRDGRACAAAIEAALRLDRGKAAEVAKIAAAAGEHEVKVGAIRALMAADEGLGVEQAVAALVERRAAWEKKKDREKVGSWRPALAGMKALVGLEDRPRHKEKLVAAIDALVALVGHEKGRMRHETHLALIDLTGKPELADDGAAWEYWWEQNRAKFEPRPKPRPKGKDGRGEGASAGGSGSTSVRFHGIPVWSDRVAFVIDLSGSMGDPLAGSDRKKLDVSKEELAKTVDAFSKEVHFNVIFFGTEVDSWQPKLVPAVDAAKRQAREFVMERQILGRTNFYGALERAILDPEADTVYFLTDGGMTTEGKYIDQRRIIRKLMEIARYSLVEVNCLLFGSERQREEGSMSRRWLESLAAATGGRFYLRPE